MNLGVQSAWLHKGHRPQPQNSQTPQQAAKFKGNDQKPLSRSKSDSFLLRHNRQEALLPQSAPAQSTLVPDSVQDVIAPLIPSLVAPDTVLENLLDSRQMQTALVQYNTACNASVKDQPDFAREAEHSFIRAVSDFTVPYNQALCHLLTASSAQLAKRDVKTINHHVQQALGSLLRYPDYIAQSLEKIKTGGHNFDELQDRLKVTDEAVRLLGQNQQIPRFFAACQQLHSDTEYVAHQSMQFSEKLQQVTLLAKQIKENWGQEETETGWGCILM